MQISGVHCIDYQELAEGGRIVDARGGDLPSSSVTASSLAQSFVI